MPMSRMESGYADEVSRLIGEAIGILAAMQGDNGRAISIIITELEKVLAYHEMFVCAPLREQDEQP